MCVAGAGAGSLATTSGAGHRAGCVAEQYRFDRCWSGHRQRPAEQLPADHSGEDHHWCPCPGQHGPSRPPRSPATSFHLDVVHRAGRAGVTSPAAGAGRCRGGRLGWAGAAGSRSARGTAPTMILAWTTSSAARTRTGEHANSSANLRRSATPSTLNHHRQLPHPWRQPCSRMIRPQRSPIIIDGALVLPEVMVGMIAALARRRPVTPRTRSWGSTTAWGSVPMRQVPTA